MPARNRKKKDRITSDRNWRRTPIYETLEAKRLLAVDLGYDLSILEDPYGRDAVTYKELVQKAAVQEYVKQQLVVAIKTNDRVAEAGFASVDWAGLTGDQGVTLLQTLTHAQRGNNERVTLVQLGLSSGGDVFQVMQRLDTRDEVMWSTPNFLYRGDPRELIPNDPQYPQQWHHPKMQNNLAWDTTLGSSTIIVAVTDDGVELNHSDLNANIWVNDDIPFDGIDNDNNGFIDDTNGWDFNSNNNNPNPNVTTDDHGTHVAGISAGRTNNGVGIAGVAGRATIMPIQFFGPAGWTAAMVNGAFRYATDNGAKIVNTSYNIDGFVNDPVFLAGLNYLYDNGVLHFNSAGNNSQLNPARQALTQTLLVASTDQTDGKSDFSNYGTGIDIAAPGSSILSTVTGNAYASFSGTSMAAPNAAGAAALIWSAYPTWTRDQVAAQLLATADNINAQNPTLVGLLGSGRVNSFKAVTQTIAAPKVRLVSNFPANGGTLDSLTIDNFDVAFDQVMDPASVNNMANFELRRAGLDGLFNTGDDVVYSLTATTYRIGSNSTNFRITEGALPYGKYRLTMNSGGVQNPFGTDLDGNGDGTGGDSYVSQFTLGRILRGSAVFSRESYTPTDLTQFRVLDGNAANPVSVTLTTSGGDQESVTLTDEGNFSWVGTLPTADGAPVAGNGKLDVSIGQTITVTYIDLDDGTGNSHTATDTAVVANTAEYASTDVPKNITDNTKITSLLPITDPGFIEDLNLRLNITHTWVGDLRATLVAPDGTRVVLFSQIGGSGDNFTNTTFDDEATTLISTGTSPYNGTFRPTEALSTLDYKPLAGTWKLEIEDLAGGDVGTLNAWSLIITSVPLAPSNLRLSKDFYTTSESVQFSVYDGNAVNPVTVTLTTTGGDQETVTLTDQGSFNWTGNIPTENGIPTAGNGKLDVFPGQTITITYIDADNGTGNSTTFTDTALVARIVNRSSTDVPKNILDNTTITSSLPITESGTLLDVNLQLNITHTFVADLRATLIGPDGTRVDLFSGNGGNGDNFTDTIFDDEAAVLISAGTAPFNGTFRPLQPLSRLDLKQINGTWLLEIADTANADTGRLNSWSLTISYIPPNAAPTNIDLAGTDWLTEGNASSWLAFADEATASVSNDSSTKMQGAYSIKLDTTGGFDAGVRYPAPVARWDLSQIDVIRFWAYGDTPSPVGWQGDQPVIKFVSAEGTLTLTPNQQMMGNREWKWFQIPLAGDSVWQRSVAGNFDITNVDLFEIHQDTWDYGFVSYYDGLYFVDLNSAVAVEIPENSGPNALVGTLSTVDPDTSDTFWYTLVPGDGSADNPSFTISGNQLIAKNDLNYEAKNSYSVRVRTTDQGGLSTEKILVIAVTDVNETPALTRAQGALSGNVLSTFTNTGTWSDPEGGLVTLSASLGTVTKNSNGTWDWSFTPSQAYNNQVVTISAVDDGGLSFQVQFTINALVAVVNSKVYYKGSTFAGTSVDAALDTSKVIAKSGATAQALTFANLINSTRGINGLVFDVAGLAASSLAASDFVFRMSPTGAFDEAANPPRSWVDTPVPNLIHVTAGNSTTPARVRLEWQNSLIANRWLQIKVLANASTGLQTPQVYYFGHLLGETNGQVEVGAFRVRGSDVSPIVAAINSAVPVPVTNVFDLDKDGRIRGSDASPAVSMVGQVLTRITIPPAGSSDEGEGGAGLRHTPGLSGWPVLTQVSERQTEVIRARLSEEVFSVAEPPSLESSAAPRNASTELLPPVDAPADHSLKLQPVSLDEYFQRLGKKKSRN